MSRKLWHARNNTGARSSTRVNRRRLTPVMNTSFVTAMPPSTGRESKQCAMPSRTFRPKRPEHAPGMSHRFELR